MPLTLYISSEKLNSALEQSAEVAKVPEIKDVTVADAMGLSRQAIHSWRSSDRGISIESLHKIVLYFRQWLPEFSPRDILRDEVLELMRAILDDTDFPELVREHYNLPPSYNFRPEDATPTNEPAFDPL